MKKYLKATFSTLIILCLIFIAYYIHTKKPLFYENSELPKMYSVLSSESNWRNKEIASTNPQAWYINDKQIEIKTSNYNGDFSCGDKKAQFINYKSNNNPSIVGSGSSVSIVNCRDYYFIFTYGDNGPHLFGPFNDYSLNKNPQ